MIHSITVDSFVAAKTRARRERVMFVLDPVVRLVVATAARLGADPLLLVTLHGACGLAAAALLAFGDPRTWPWAALLLLAKVVLDNADGRLARATGRVTRMGRYYDTAVDLLVNLALFLAMAPHAGPLLALAAFLALTFLLSLDYNLDRLYRVPRTVVPGGPPPADAPLGAPEPAYRLIRGVYDRLLAPQDRLIERLDRSAFRRLEGAPYAEAPLDRRLAWSDHFSVATVSDLGLSTQMLILAAFVLAGRPGLYPPVVLAMLAWALAVQLVRASRYRAYRSSDPEASGHAG